MAFTGMQKARPSLIY